MNYGLKIHRHYTCVFNYSWNLLILQTSYTKGNSGGHLDEVLILMAISGCLNRIFGLCLWPKTGTWAEYAKPTSNYSRSSSLLSCHSL